MGAAGVLMNFFNGGAVDPVLATGQVAGSLWHVPSYPSLEDRIQCPKKVS